MEWLFLKKAILLITIPCLYIFVQPQIPRTLAEKARKEPHYVGMEKCKECHSEHVKTYSGWKYSRNFRILEMRGYEEYSVRGMPWACKLTCKGTHRRGTPEDTKHPKKHLYYMPPSA